MACEESMRELILILMTCYKRYQFEIILTLIVKILKIDNLMEGQKKTSIFIMSMFILLLKDIVFNGCFHIKILYTGFHAS